MNEILKKRIDERLKIVEEGAVAFFTGEDSAVAAQYLELVKMAFTVGAEYALKSQWISIDEALPDKKEYDWVLVRIRMNDGFICVPKVGEIRSDGHWHCAEYDDLYKMGESFEEQMGCKVTHWMPIPEMEE